MSKEQRQQKLLQIIVQEYIKSARPISSKMLVGKCGFNCSSATIRNDMADLERAGYIIQPYTSAGRIPTEKAYQYYIKHFLHKKELENNKKEVLEQVIQEDDEQKKIKTLAKTIADFSDEAVVISYNGNTYLTGVSNIFKKPEFSENAELMASVGEMFDHLDEVMDVLNNKIQEDVQVLIGHDNPFSDSCSLIASEYEVLDDVNSTFGILGPMRMDYDTNIAIMKFMESLINEEHE